MYAPNSDLGRQRTSGRRLKNQKRLAQLQRNPYALPLNDPYSQPERNPYGQSDQDQYSRPDENISAEPQQNPYDEEPYDRPDKKVEQNRSAQQLRRKADREGTLSKAGQAMKTAGTAAQATGAGVQAAGKAAQVGGKATQAVGGAVGGATGGAVGGATGGAVGGATGGIIGGDSKKSNALDEWRTKTMEGVKTPEDVRRKRAIDKMKSGGGVSNDLLLNDPVIAEAWKEQQKKRAEGNNTSVGEYRNRIRRHNRKQGKEKDEKQSARVLGRNRKNAKLKKLFTTNKGVGQLVTIGQRFGWSIVLKWSWTGLIATYGLSLIYINIHFFMAYFVRSKKFVKFGREWAPRLGSSKSGASDSFLALIGLGEIFALVILDLIIVLAIVGQMLIFFFVISSFVDIIGRGIPFIPFI